MTLPTPEPSTVLSAAFVFAEMAPPALEDAQRKLFGAIVTGMVQRGWPEPEARRFGQHFVRAVADAMDHMQPGRTRH